MTRRTRWIVTVAAAAMVAAGIGGGIAVAGGVSDADQPITGPARAKAEEAALAHTGSGRVTDTEVGDEESYYEVEVTLPDGRQVDVQLDKEFGVVGSSGDEQPDDESSGDDREQ
jgi:Peptidase propeptide and YPEB domain